MFERAYRDDPLRAPGLRHAHGGSTRLLADAVLLTPTKMAALHLMVTPEYRERVLSEFPSMVVCAVRLDRGLSRPVLLETGPDERWEEERGLDEHQYIVPGAGGLGEILNNSYV